MFFKCFLTAGSFFLNFLTIILYEKFYFSKLIWINLLPRSTLPVNSLTTLRYLLFPFFRLFFLLPLLVNSRMRIATSNRRSPLSALYSSAFLMIADQFVACKFLLEPCLHKGVMNPGCSNSIYLLIGGSKLLQSCSLFLEDNRRFSLEFSRGLNLLMLII